MVPVYCIRALLQAQWRIEQAAMKSGEMGPDSRSRAGDPRLIGDADGGGTGNLASTIPYSGGGEKLGNGDANGHGGGNIIGIGGIPGIGTLPEDDSLEQIYQSTRTWCRMLRRSPIAMEVLIASTKEKPRSQSGIIFNQYLSDLTGIMYRRLSTTVEEEVGTTALPHSRWLGSARNVRGCSVQGSVDQLGHRVFQGCC